MEFFFFHSCFLNEFLKHGENPDGSIPKMVFEQVPLSHPVFISYTSGTTGLPKALVHGSGVSLLKTFSPLSLFLFFSFILSALFFICLLTFFSFQGLLSISRDFWLHTEADRSHTWLSMSPVCMHVR